MIMMILMKIMILNDKLMCDKCININDVMKN